MNKLLYAELIKHINRSIIKPSQYYVYSEGDITLCARNPVSKTNVYLNKTSLRSSYRVYLHDIPFGTPEEAEKLFKYAEKRYYEHFKNAESEQLAVYITLLKSNANTINR